MMKQFNDFTNLYPVSKTLRFELKPIGKTLDNIKNADIIKKDNHRADSYQKVKKIIDEYHKVFIDTALNRFGRAEIRQDMTELLRSYYNLYLNGNKTKEEDKKFEKIQTDLRELIVSVLTGAKGKYKDKDQNGRYKNLFKEELIRDILPSFVSSDGDRKLLSEFKGFTTYFVGFHENRKNIYSDQAHSTAISYRLIHENLPRFIDNLLIFEKIKDPLSHELSDLYTTFTDGGYINVPRLNDIFTLEHYTHVLSQKGIESYNAVIGKVVGEDGTEYKGLNERINLYNQRQNRKEDRLPLFKPLYKQILSDREQLSWLPETYADDDELLESIKTFCEYLDSDVLDRTRVLMRSISDYDLSKIYIRNDAQLTDISKWIFGDWNLINKARELAYDLTTTAKKGTARYEDNRKKALNAEKSLTIATLNECIKLLPEEYCEKQIDEYFSELRKVDHNEGDALDLIEVIKLSYTNTKQLLTTPYPEDYNLIQDKANVALIKSLLDSVSNLQRFLKPLIGYGDESDKDQKFYGELNYIWEALNQIIPLYNMVRNYLTRKPYSTEKIKLNFGNSQLLIGWDRNKERDNTSIILRKDGNYYHCCPRNSEMGIMRGLNR